MTCCFDRSISIWLNVNSSIRPGVYDWLASHSARKWPACIRDVNEARTLEAEARTLEAEAEAKTLEAKAEAKKFWPPKFNKF